MTKQQELHQRLAQLIIDIHQLAVEQEQSAWARWRRDSQQVTQLRKRLEQHAKYFKVKA